jgi:hypothetical protein
MAQILSSLSCGTGRNVELEVLVAVVVHLAVCRSKRRAGSPEAATATSGTPTTNATVKLATSTFRLQTLLCVAVGAFYTTSTRRAAFNWRGGRTDTITDGECPARKPPTVRRRTRPRPGLGTPRQTAPVLAVLGAMRHSWHTTARSFEEKPTDRATRGSRPTTRPQIALRDRQRGRQRVRELTRLRESGLVAGAGWFAMSSRTRVCSGREARVRSRPCWRLRQR